jgi:aspartokinase/homoserine dehydrogenase 1
MPVLKINIVLFGKGNVGKEFLDQVIENQKTFLEKRNIEIHFPIITNSRLAYFEKEGVDKFWESNFALRAIPYQLEDIIEYVKIHNLENLIAIDLTDSEELVKNYIPLIQNGFNIVAANKNANTSSIEFYKEVRKNLERYGKTFLYETNVGS